MRNEILKGTTQMWKEIWQGTPQTQKKIWKGNVGNDLQ